MSVSTPKIILAPDSFKGSLSAAEVAGVLAEAVAAVCPHATAVKLPLADGGEGSAATIISAVGGSIEEARVLSPDGREIVAQFGITADGQAVLELAQSSGLTKQVGLHPMTANTYGFGQVILHALERGLREFYLCLGGSATTDGGCGMAAALGIVFLDEEGASFTPSGATLQNIARIDASKLDKRVRESTFTVLCDVDNPLHGPNGAASIYSPQKGADPSQVIILDEGLRHLSKRMLHLSDAEHANKPGAGAAGGLAFGCAALLNAQLVSGIDAILKLCHFQQQLADACLIITGEGRLDTQSFSGKALSGILRNAGDVPVISICGVCDCTHDELCTHGLAAYAISEGFSLEESLAHPVEHLRHTAERALSLQTTAAQGGACC